ncbi:putative NRPS-like protein biosynthetic cluster, partial [Aspergillus brasiliensis]
FEFLIDQLCQSDPDRPVGDLEAFSPNDLREIRALHPENIPSVETSFPAIFAEQVARNPEALAVDSQHGVKLTYAELDRLSDGLARYLISLGLMPQDKVGWCSEKTPWTVVGIVAIAKAGGIFMFLDPSHPPSRRAEILQTGQPRLILAISPHDGLFQYPDAQPVDAVVLVDERLLTELRDQKHGALPDSLQPDSGLYIQFTSGSTGTPKGCLVEHSNFLSSAAIYTHRTNLTQQSRVFQVSSYNFDSSILEMLASLTVGACVCVPREEARSDDDLPGTMNDLAVTWALITPSLARTLLATSVPSLQDLVLAGEALSEVDVKTWAASVRLYNGYGPAECAILTTVNRIVNTDVAPNELGKPLASANWIVCPQDPNKLAPLGAVGELLIEGSIVGRGYLNDSHRTVASFIRPPRWLEQYHSAARSSQKHRVYLTGDLVRYTRDGSISYVGRKDLQVKIRGQRVELGEIEHRLWTHSLVNNAVVVYPTSGRCSRQLVGFLALTRVTSFAQNPDDVTLLPNHVLPTITEDVRIIENSLSSQLPSYMIPTVWVPLSSIPLLVSGKSNRRILLNWLAGLDEPTFTMIVNLGQNESTETRPWSQTEETLRTIWGKVLNLPFERIHLNSSFLRLGGNSISAMQVAGLARKANVDFPLTAVLGSSSLKELATSARAIPKISRAKAPSLVGVPFALSPMQQFYAQVALGEDELSLTTNRQFHYSFPFRLTSHTTVSQLDEAIQRIVKRHPMLRARFQRQQRGNERHSQMITNEVFTSYRLQTHQSSALEDTRSALDASRVSLDIYSGPLLAADLVETETDQVLFFTIHHLVTDM